MWWRRAPSSHPHPSDPWVVCFLSLFLLVCFSVVQNAPSLPKVTQGLPIGHVSPPPRERAQRGTRPPRRAIPPLARPSRPAPQPLRRRTAPRGGRLCRGLARRLFTAGGVKRVSHTRPPTRSGAARASLLLRPRVAADCPREQLPRRGGGGVHGADPNHTNNNHDHNLITGMSGLRIQGPTAVAHTSKCSSGASRERDTHTPRMR